MSKYEKLMPVSRPSLGQDELAEVGKVFESHWLGLGAWVLRFENRIKSFLSAKSVIAVNTGTSALHLALDALNLKEGDEVIVPSLTFAASIQAIAACKASPKFCDIEEDTLNIDSAEIKKLITDKTKAIMPVHYCGLPCDMDEIIKIAKDNDLRVVEDAAHAFGSYYKNRLIGSFGDVTCFSFDPIKNITCGEGGCIVTGDEELTKIIYKKRILGIDKDTWSRYEHKRDWFYEVTDLGFRYHMSNINAAIGLVQMDKLPQFIAKKRELVKKYDENFRNLKEIKLLVRDVDNIAPFNYIIRVQKRDELMNFLKENGIDSGVHYIPNHIQPFFSKFDTTGLKVTDMVWKEIITLPLFFDMLDSDQDRVIECIKRFYKN